MEFAKVNVDVRAAAKKGAARKVRSSGQVPGVLYGRKREPIAVTFNEKELMSSLDKEKRRNTVLKLTLRDAGKSEEVTAMVRDAQVNPLSRRLVHVDFLAVDLRWAVDLRRADEEREVILFETCVQPEDGEGEATAGHQGLRGR